LALTRTDASPTALDPSARRRVRELDLPTLAWLVAIAIAIAYVIVFVLSLSHNLTRLAWNPSVSSAFTMSETLVKTGSGGATAMGSTPQWASLWFGLVTATLPLHRPLWEVAPTLLFLATSLIVGWSVLQLAGRRAAILAVAIGVVASPIALTFFMAPFSHNTVYPCTALLDAYLIWLARPRPRRRLTTFAVPPLLGVVVGTCLSSDALLAATAVVPLALAMVLAAIRREQRSKAIALSALVTIVVALPVAKLTSAIMRSAGYLTLPTPVKLAALSELPSRAHLLFTGLQELFNGYLGYEKPGLLHSQLGVACDVVMSAALLGLLVIGIRGAASLIVAGVRRNTEQSDAQLSRSLHVVYWTSATILPAAAFWVAGEGPVTTHESYYATSIFAVAAVLPLLLSGGAAARVLIPVGASILFAASLVGLKDNYINISTALASSEPTVVKIAEANHLQVGYANWGDASPLTWSSHNRVIVRPVVECALQEDAALCPGFQAYVPSWYVPRQRRTFLLVEAKGVDLNAAPANLGKPLAVYAFESMKMYIYPYDIASRFGPAVN
jgi:hypothetical protein